MSQRRVILNELSQSEIGHVRFTLFVQKDISRFEIAVQNAALMGVMDCARDRG